MKNKNWTKEEWSYFGIACLGLLLIVIGGYYYSSSIKGVICISVGCSLVATVTSSFLFSKAQDRDIVDLYSISEKIYDATWQAEPNRRVVQGKHLKSIFRDTVHNEMASKDSFLEIDVIGMELYNFWNDQKDLIMKYPNFRVRLIVQDPESEHFNDMVLNEQIASDVVKQNVHDITREINELELNANQSIEIRWIYFPASVTITRVNNQLYARTRLINSSHADEHHFFEKYVKNDLPFTTFTDYFDNAWGQWESAKFEKFKQSKKHYDEYLKNSCSKKI